MRCFSCNAAVELAAGERIGFGDSCDDCGADLRVCRNCAHHDPSSHNECREPGTEWVSDRERANRCEWFRAGAGGGGERHAEQQRSRSQLDNLFKKS